MLMGTGGGPGNRDYLMRSMGVELGVKITDTTQSMYPILTSGVRGRCWNENFRCTSFIFLKTVDWNPVNISDTSTPILIEFYSNCCAY